MSNRRRWFAFLLIVLLALLGIYYLLQSRLDRGGSSPGISDLTDSSASMPASRPAPAGSWLPPVIVYDWEPGYQYLAEYDRIYRGTQGTFIILVRVYSGELQPIAGASVSLYRSTDSISDTFTDLLAASTTDESGCCRIELDSPLVLGYLVAGKPGFVTSQSAVALEEPGLLKRDFALNSGSAFIQGRVTDARGTPIAGAMLINSIWGAAEDQTRASRVTAITDSSGDYQIGPLPSGNAVIGASAEGYTGASVKLAYLERDELRTNVDFSLQPSETTFVDVCVLDSARLPIRGATIATSLGQASLSGSDGIVRLHIKSEDASDSFQCSVKANGYKTRFTVIDPQQARSEVVLENANTLSGIVTAPGDLPLAGAKIRIIAPGSVQEAGTDAAGNFSLAIDVSPGYATISRTGYVDSRVDYDVFAASRFLRITLVPSGGIYGRAVDEFGRPVWKYRVTVRDLESRKTIQLPRFFSSFDGDFALTDLPPGKFSLDFQGMVSTRGWPQQGRIDACEVRPGFIFGPVTVVLKAPGR